MPVMRMIGTNMIHDGTDGSLSPGLSIGEGATMGYYSIPLDNVPQKKTICSMFLACIHETCPFHQPAYSKAGRLHCRVPIGEQELDLMTGLVVRSYIYLQPNMDEVELVEVKDE